MTRTRVQLTLDPSTLSLLERVDNRSGYVDAVLQQRWRDWRAALEVVRQSGWTSSEVLAVMDACNGWLRDGHTPASFLAAELADAAALAGLVDRWGLDGDAWQARCREVAEHEHLAQSLLRLADEFWAGNTEAEARIRGLVPQPAE